MKPAKRATPKPNSRPEAQTRREGKHFHPGARSPYGGREGGKTLSHFPLFALYHNPATVSRWRASRTLTPSRDYDTAQTSHSIRGSDTNEGGRRRGKAHRAVAQLRSGRRRAGAGHKIDRRALPGELKRLHLFLKR